MLIQVTLEILGLSARCVPGRAAGPRAPTRLPALEVGQQQQQQQQNFETMFEHCTNNYEIQ